MAEQGCWISKRTRIIHREHRHTLPVVDSSISLKIPHRNCQRHNTDFESIPAPCRGKAAPVTKNTGDINSMYIANRTLSALDTDDFGSFSSLDKLTPSRARPLTPVDMCQGYTVPIVYKDETWEEIERKKKAANACGSSSTLSSELPWKERKSRIDNALSWLRTELETMRVQDKALLGQLQRCQETIESIKQQRALWEECSEDDLDEGDEDHWEDWEISEFERSFAEGSEYPSSTLSSKDSRSSGSTTTSGVSSMASQRSDRSDRSEKLPSMYQFSSSSSSSQTTTSKVSRTNSYFRQDLEVTV